MLSLDTLYITDTKLKEKITPKTPVIATTEAK